MVAHSELAADLVRRRVAAIVPVGNAVFAVKAATSTIPIVFVASMDPAAMGVVASLNHPGGNITGVTTLNVDVESKRLELLHELLPGMSRVAFLVNPTNPNLVVYTQDAQAAARSLGLELHVVMAGSERDFGPAFDALDAQKVGVLSLMALRVISRRRGISLVFRAKRT